MVALAGGTGLLVDAGLLAIEGTSSLALAHPLGPSLVPLLAFVGGIAAVAGAFSGGRATWRAAGRSAPQMYPFGPPWMQVGIYLLVAVAAAAIPHALLVAYTGADSSGAAASPDGSGAGDTLLVAGSLVVWVLAAYAVYGLRRFIQMGRELDRRRGIDPFQSRSGPPGIDEPPWAPRRRPAPPALAGAVVAVGSVTTVLLIELSVGIQLLETPIGPVAPSVFWGSQLGTIAVALGVTVTLRAIDRGVRDVERQYATSDGPVPRANAPAVAPPTSGFVP